jgi:DNA invertase Pin-like site-specific DNA recombinase
MDEDLGKSGSSSERRTGWQSLKAKIQARQVGAVFVANISRLSRQVHDFELFRLEAALHNVLLYADGRFINPADSGDAALSQMSAMFAQYENRKRAEIMMHARLAKAKRGETVSALPVGWIKTPDGGYDYDPETKERIQLVIRTFRETNSLYQTVKALAQAGVKMPCKMNSRNPCTKPNMQQVRKILTDPAYSGTYIYGKIRVHLGSSTIGGGRSKKIKLPEDRWIKISAHHPAYLSREEQEEIKKIVEKNRRICRNPIVRIRPLTEGLLRCAVCGSRLGVF